LIHRRAVEVSSGASYGSATGETRWCHCRVGSSPEHGGQGAPVYQL
jgi:hypothetical protein